MTATTISRRGFVQAVGALAGAGLLPSWRQFRQRRTIDLAPTQQQQSLREQAERTAWRLMLDWVAVQMSMIEMRQAELVQVFLPYIWNGTTTLFQQMKSAQTPAIGYSGKPESEMADEELAV